MRVALATSAAHPHLEEEDLPLLDALLERDVDALPVVWNSEDNDWSSFDAVLIRSTWDYHEQHDHFLAWTEEVASALPLFNDAPTVRWNTHKAYLNDLGDAGLPVVPTTVLRGGDAADVGAVLAELGLAEAVAKLAVSASGHHVVRVRGDAAGQQAIDELLGLGDVLIQPFLPDVFAAGELSVVVIAGEETHAVRKRSGGEDFRVNVAGGWSREDVDDATADLARRVVRATPGGLPLYARVDLLPRADDLLVVELELVEPSLFFTSAPRAAARLADALLDRLKDHL